jgi:hypothetical protein
MSIRLNGSTSGYTEIDAPAVAGSNTLVLPTGNGAAHQLLKNGATAGQLEYGFTLPSGNGSNGQVLSTNGSGTLSWIGAGKILQVVSANLDGESASGSTSFTDAGLSVSITPSSASNKVFAFYSGSAGNNGTQESYLTLVRGSTNLGNGSQGLMRVWYSGSTGYHFGGYSMSYLDSPSTTSATTYKVQYRTASGIVYISAGGSRDTLTVFEVAA